MRKYGNAKHKNYLRLQKRPLYVFLFLIFFGNFNFVTFLPVARKKTILAQITIHPS